MRSILYVNIPSFFVEIERKRRPELVGRPIVVGAPKGNTSGMVVSVSTEAKVAGVEEGISVRRAQRACPEAVVLKADYALYGQVFEIFLDTLAQYSPLLEPDSFGSAYLDVTASRALFGDAAQIAERVISEVSERLQMPVSIGCGSNKLIARVASTIPNSKFQIPNPKSERSFLAPLPVGVLDAVTERIEKRLRELGVTTVGRLAMIPERLLAGQFGPVGHVLKSQSLGIDTSPVKAAYPPEVITIEQTFCSTLEEPSELEAYLRMMAAEAELTLRRRRSLAGEIELRLQVAGYRLQSYYRFKKPTDSAAHMLQTLAKLVRSAMQPGMRVSGVEIVLSNLVRGDGIQLSLVGKNELRTRLDRTVELIRQRFGEGSVIFAASLAPSGRARVLSRIAA